jgi:dipeptidase E
VSPPETPLEQRTIFAMGGGGFTMEPSNPLLDDFVLSLAALRLGGLRARARARKRPIADTSAASAEVSSGDPPGDPPISSSGNPDADASPPTAASVGAPAREPRILFLPTASGDTTAQINAFYARFADRVCIAEHLSLFRLRESRRPLAEIVLTQDILYVGGGSMRNLLAIWRAHELDRLLTDAWRRGIVLAGISAGAMCWLEGGITRSSGPPEPLAGLGLLTGSLTVHADGEPERLPVWLAAVREGVLPGGWAVDDGVGLLFRGERLDRLVSSRPGAGAQRVDAIAGELVRHRLQPELLGASAGAGALGAVDEDIQELRRVHRFRRGVTGARGRLGGA